MAKERNIQIDIVRGIGIILVVLGHAAFPATHFIYLFHLAIFFIIAGYFFKEEYIENKRERKKYLLNKIKRLYIPYVIGNIICIILNNLFIQLNLYNIETHQYLSLGEIIINIIKVFLFGGTTEMLGATWFLKILFIISILYFFIEIILNKYCKKYKNTIQILISIIFLIIGCTLSLNNINIKFIGNSILTCYILFDFGRKLSNINLNISNKFKFLIIILTFIILCICNLIGGIEISKNEYTNSLYFLIVSIAGWFFVYYISYFLTKIPKLNKILQYIGKNTMPILILHFATFKIVNLIGVLILKEKITLISTFPVLFENGWIWLIYTIIGILIPIIINCIYIKLKNKLKGLYNNEIRCSNSNIQ